MAIKVTKQSLVSGGGERLGAAEKSVPEEIEANVNGEYVLHHDQESVEELRFPEGIRVRELKSLSNPSQIWVSFTREMTTWNLDGPRQIFKQDYFNSEGTEQSFSMLNSVADLETVHVVFQQGQIYKFKLIDPFRKEQATITIEC